MWNLIISQYNLISSISCQLDAATAATKSGMFDLNPIISPRHGVCHSPNSHPYESRSRLLLNTNFAIPSLCEDPSSWVRSRYSCRISASPSPFPVVPGFDGRQPACSWITILRLPIPGSRQHLTQLTARNTSLTLPLRHPTLPGHRPNNTHPNHASAHHRHLRHSIMLPLLPPRLAPNRIQFANASKTRSRIRKAQHHRAVKPKGRGLDGDTRYAEFGADYFALFERSRPNMANQDLHHRGCAEEYDEEWSITT